jgi:prepilin peptidase CpaA
LTYLPPGLQGLLVLLVVAAAVFDLRQRRIPNWLAASGLVAGIAMNTFLFESDGFWTSLKGAGLALLIYVPLFALRAMGAGDAKLMAAVGSITGPMNWVGIMILTSLFGGLLAVLLVLGKGRVRHTLENVKLILTSWRFHHLPYHLSPELDVGSEQALRLPHAVSILVGVGCFLVAAAIWAPR